MEASRPRYRPRYVMLHDERGPLAVAASAAASPIASPGGWQERIASSLALTFGAPFSASVSGVLVRADMALSTVLPTIESALTELCWREHRILLGFTNVGADDLQTFRDRGFIAMPRPSTMALDLDSADYDGYLRSLRKDDRAELRRARRRAAEHATELQYTRVDDASRALFPLLVEVCARHGIPPDRVTITEELFPALRREMADDTYILSATVRGQLAGFALCLVQQDTLFAPMLGLHYELSMPSCLYAVLIDEIVRLGVNRRVRRVHLGLGNERQKRRHGFRPQARWACVRAPLNPVNLALQTAARLSATRLSAT